LTDIEAGKSAGCKTILMSNLKLDILEVMFKKSGTVPDILVKSLVEALDDILSGRDVHPFSATGLMA